MSSLPSAAFKHQPAAPARQVLIAFAAPSTRVNACAHWGLAGCRESILLPPDATTLLTVRSGLHYMPPHLENLPFTINRKAAAGDQTSSALAQAVAFHEDV